MSRFSDALHSQPLLFDGGLGTALIAAGLDLKQEPPEAWLRSRPDEVRAVHAAFAAAGADVLQTNSFGLLRLLRSGHPICPRLDLAIALAQQSVQLASESGRYTVAALGPSGLAPSRLEADTLRDWVTALSAAFAAAGAEALHLETACDATELAALLEGAWAGPLPVLVSLTVSLGQSGMETPLGVPMSRMLRAIAEAPLRPIAVGVNCSLPARRMRRPVSELAEWAAGQRGTPPRVLVQPQVDEPAPDCKRPPAPETPERFAHDLLLLRGDGAELLGGCCGCRPEHIAAVRALLSHDPSQPPNSQ